MFNQICKYADAAGQPLKVGIRLRDTENTFKTIGSSFITLCEEEISVPGSGVLRGF